VHQTTSGLPAWLPGFSFLTLIFLKVPVDLKSAGTFFY
jgi:hypothetical protein